MHSVLMLGIVLFIAIVNTAPATDGINPDGTTSYLGDQLDSELNFQPLPKIVTLAPENADPKSNTGTNTVSQVNPPKPVVSTANSELNPYGGNATTPELPKIKSDDPDPTRNYFRENDFKCPKEANLIGCCDGGDFAKCDTCNDSLFLLVLPESCRLILQNWSRPCAFIVGAQKPICKKTKNMSCCHLVGDLLSSSKPKVGSLSVSSFILLCIHVLLEFFTDDDGKNSLGLPMRLQSHPAHWAVAVLEIVLGVRNCVRNTHIVIHYPFKIATHDDSTRKSSIFHVEIWDILSFCDWWKCYIV